MKCSIETQEMWLLVYVFNHNYIFAYHYQIVYFPGKNIYGRYVMVLKFLLDILYAYKYICIKSPKVNP